MKALACAAMTNAAAALLPRAPARSTRSTEGSGAFDSQFTRRKHASYARFTRVFSLGTRSSRAVTRSLYQGYVRLLALSSGYLPLPLRLAAEEGSR